eukprot:COSAG05_NODE_7603_length_791_cov_0.865607_2_plen_78_part_01
MIREVPPDFDLISVDAYSGYTPTKPGMNEVRLAQAAYESIWPKLHAHQQVLLVPGVFGCSKQIGSGHFPLEAQEKHMY